MIIWFIFTVLGLKPECFSCKANILLTELHASTACSINIEWQEHCRKACSSNLVHKFADKVFDQFYEKFNFLVGSLLFKFPCLIWDI